MQSSEEEEWGSMKQKGGQYGLSEKQEGVVYSELERPAGPWKSGALFNSELKSLKLNMASCTFLPLNAMSVAWLVQNRGIWIVHS